MATSRAVIETTTINSISVKPVRLISCYFNILQEKVKIDWSPYD